MQRKKLWIVGAIVAVVLLVLVIIPLVFDANRYRPEIESRLSQALGRQVKIGDLKLSLFSGGIKANDISIADDPAFSREPFIHAKSLTVGVQMKPLIFNRELHIESVVLNEPVVRLLQSASGKWNMSTLGQKKQKSADGGQTSRGDIQVSKFEIVNGRIEAGQSNGKQQAYTDLQLKITDLSSTSSFPYMVSAKTPGSGKISVEGKAGPLNHTDMSRTPFSGDVEIDNLDLASTGFMGPDSGVGGILDYKGKLSSDGRTATSNGTAKVSKLRVVKTGTSAGQPVEVDYHSNFDLAREQGVVDQTNIRTGKSVTHLKGTYATRGTSTELDLKLTGDKLAVQEIESLLPALGIILPSGSSLQGGTLTESLNLRGPADKLVTTGTVNIADSKIAGFSLGKGLSGIVSLAGISNSSDTTIQTLSSNLRIAPEGTRVENLNLVVVGLGTITGNGTIGADSSLDFHLVAQLANGGDMVGALTQIAGVKGSGLKSIPISVKGTTAKPIFIPDINSAMAGGATSGIGSGAQVQQNPVGSILGIFGKKKK